MKNWKQFAFMIVVLFGFFFMSGFFVRYHLPKLKSWLLIEMETQSEAKTPFRIRAKAADLSFFPLGVVFSEVEVDPKGELKSQLAPVKLSHLSLGINWLALFAGEVRISSLRIQNPEVILILNDNPFKRGPGERPQSKNINIDWKTIFDIPIDEVSIEKLSLTAKFKNADLAFQLKDFSASVENRYDSLLAAIDAPSITFKQLGPQPQLNFSLETRFLMDPREIQLAALKIQRSNSYLVASGRVNGNFSKMDAKNGALDLRGSMDLSEVKAWADTLFGFTQLPDIHGVADFDSSLSMSANAETPKMELSVETRGFRINQFEIDQVIANANLKEKVLSFKDMRVQNSAGQIRLKDLVVDLNDKVSFSTVVASPSLEGGKLLRNLGLDVPLTILITGEFPCRGDFNPQVKIHCTGSAQGQNFHLFPGETHNTLLKIPKLSANGSVDITHTGVFYKADIALAGKSKGSSQGDILYKTGFKISYNAENLELSEIEDFLGLDLEGHANLSGSTEGDSHRGTMKMDVSAQDFWIKDYLLGQVQAEARYGDGVVTIRKIKGAVGTSRFEGQLSLNLTQDQLLLNAKFPFADLDDVKTMLSRRLPLPFSVSGTGSGELRATGAIDIDKLNYELDSSFYRGTVEKESFDDLIVKVKGSNAVAKAQTIRMTKGKSEVDLQGTLAHSGTIDTVIVGRDLRLEQSEMLGKVGFDMTGKFDFTMAITGVLPDPRIETNGRLSNLVIGDRPSDDSNFKLVLDSNSLTGNGNFIGTTVKTNFIWPLKQGVPFEFNFKSKEWDFTQLFQILSQTARQKDFETKLTSSISLKSANGKIWSSDGQVKIDQFYLKRGELGLFSRKPMFLNFNNGKISAKDFFMEGDNSFLRLVSDSSTEENLNASLDGKFDMGLISILTPFLEDLRGPLSFSVNFQGSFLDPQIVGSAYIENGSLKLKEFPHPLSRMRSDILFNQKNILINAFQAELAGGQISGDGRIKLIKLDEVPVDFKAQFKDVSVNFPEGMKSQGSGNLRVTGDYFPYLLSMEYKVDQANVTMEFSGTSEDQNIIKPSTFLPKFLTEARSQVIRFDLDVDLLKPAVVKNSMMDALVSGSVAIKGTPDNPMLKGVLTPLPGGKLIFRENIFEINTGYVEYNFDPPDNPTLFMTSQARVTEVVYNQDRESTNEYDVRLLAQGKAKDPKITLESQPPLSEREIISLLALGVTSGGGDQSSTGGDRESGAATGVIGTQIGAQLFGSQIGKQFKDRLGVEFKIGTQFNTVDNASYPKVTFSKQWTPKFEASASRTIEQRPTSDVKLEYKFNDNTSMIGFWEGKEQDTSKTTPNEEESKVGLDLEYKIEFK